MLSVKMDYIGPATSYISAEGSKISSTRLMISSVRPTWDIILCNPRTLTYCRKTFNKWEHRFTESEDAVLTRTPQEPAKEKMLNLKLDRCQCLKAGHQIGKTTWIQYFRILSTPDLKVPKQVSRGFWRAMELPDMPGFPIRVLKREGRISVKLPDDLTKPPAHTKANTGDLPLKVVPSYPEALLTAAQNLPLVTTLDTLSCTKHTVTTTELAVPPHMKRVETEMDVLLQEDPNGEVKQIFH